MNVILSGSTWSRVVAVLITAITLFASAPSSAAVYLSVAVEPPLLPVYEQPLIPGPGYIWTPGYWGWGLDGFYWVPGTWILAPYVGALWTPGYWGWRDNFYWWYPGYWGRHVGFYGGINYGFGYTGLGYEGGYWDRGFFTYNRTFNNINITNIRNVYSTPAVNNTTLTRVSYNGGPSGVLARPTAQDRIAAQDAHTPLRPVQARHELAASSNHALLASVNNGHPALAATPRPQSLSAVGPTAPSRSFSQQAAAQASAVPLRNNASGPTARLSNQPRFGGPNASMSANAPQSRSAPGARAEMAQRDTSPQAQVRSQAEMRQRGPTAPQAQVRSQAEMRQRGPMAPQAQLRSHGEMPPQSQGAPVREGRLHPAQRNRDERPDERQRP